MINLIFINCGNIFMNVKILSGNTQIDLGMLGRGEMETLEMEVFNILDDIKTKKELLYPLQKKGGDQ